MLTIFFLLPSLACRAAEFSFRDKKAAFQGLLEDSFILGIALLLFAQLPQPAAILLWTLFFPLQFLGWYLPWRFGIPLSLDLVHFLRHPGSFLDSARAIHAGPAALCAAGLLFLSYLGFLGSSPFYIPLLAAGLPSYLFKSRETENPLFSPLRFRKKEKTPPFEWNFPQESSAFLSPRYPLLRKTFAFKGEKQFQLPHEGKPNIVFLFMESFRAKNVGCLGGEIPASPRFDALAEKGVLFTNFYAGGLQTYRSFLASFFSIPPHLETLSLHPYCSLPLIGLPSILKEQGYRTALIQGGSASFDSSLPFFQTHGFETILGKEDFTAPQNQITSWGVSDETLFSQAAHWIGEQTAPFFLSLFTISNHHPWHGPAGWSFPTPSDLPAFYQRFLNTFSYSDHALGLFIEQLKKENRLGNTIFFIFGDHGQGMGERGRCAELHNDLYQENIHVPLLIFAEKIAPARIETPASQLDLLPTVLDLLNLPAVHHSTGKSLLRKGSSPLFLSLPRGYKQVGCIDGNWKLTAGAGRTELYDLARDPNERNNLAPSPLSSELEQKAHSYFQSVEALYKEKAWAPASLQKLSFEIAAPRNSTHEDWIRILDSAPFAPIVDLSNASRLTDRALFAIGPKRASQIHELNLSNSPLFTDRSLRWIGQNCPQLMIFNASHCPLLTEEALCEILNNCPKLRFLSLEGMDQIENLNAAPPTQELAALFLKDCHKIQGSALARLAAASPHLVYLAASLANTGKEEFLSIAASVKQMAYAWFFQGLQIDDKTLQAYADLTPSLLILILEDFPLLTTLPSSLNTHILKLSDCPNLADSALEEISRQPIKELLLSGCPKITGKGLEKLLRIPGCKIVLENCPGVLPEEILALRARGLNIY